jgi:hypothetical protein
MGPIQPPIQWVPGVVSPGIKRPGRETSRLPHYLDNRLTDDGKIVSLARRTPFTPGKIPGTHFC